MSFLTLNNMSLPVAADSVSVSEEEIGESGRSFDGTPYKSVRSVKRAWTAKTTAMSQAEAAAWKAVIRGDGQTADFETDTWTAQGMAAWTSGGAARTADHFKFGTRGMDTPAAGAFGWAGMFPGGVGTFFFWDALADDSWAACTDGARYKNGAAFAGAFPGAIAGADIAVGGFDIVADDFWSVSAVLTPAMIAGLHAADYAKPALPRLLMAGDIVSSAVEVVGAVKGSRVMRGMVGGSFASNLEEISFELREV